MMGHLERVAAERYGDGGYYVDPERRRIPDHWHAHARPAPRRERGAEVGGMSSPTNVSSLTLARSSATPANHDERAIEQEIQAKGLNAPPAFAATSSSHVSKITSRCSAISAAEA